MNQIAFFRRKEKKSYLLHDFQIRSLLKMNIRIIRIFYQKQLIRISSDPTPNFKKVNLKIELSLGSINDERARSGSWQQRKINENYKRSADLSQGNSREQDIAVGNQKQQMYSGRPAEVH